MASTSSWQHPLLDVLKNRVKRKKEGKGIKKLARRSKLVQQFRAKHEEGAQGSFVPVQGLGIKTADKVEARQKIYGALYDLHV